MFPANGAHLSVQGQHIGAYMATALVSFLVCLFIIRLSRTHIGLTTRAEDLLAVQASHRTPTPRIGGVAIFLGLELAAGLLSGPALGLLSAILLAAVPVTVAGLLEDMGRRISPKARLAAAVASALLATHLTGNLIGRVDVPLLDGLMAFGPLAVAFTAFAVAGACNAVNLVDGMNGLAGTLVTISAAGLAVLSARHGQADLAAVAILLISVLAGFLALNFPRGQIFLGDAGAYLIGFVLAWLSVTLAARVPGVSVWAIMLVNFWPVADTLLAIYRRRSNGRDPSLPDRLHFHQLIKRSLEIQFLGSARWALSNPLTTIIIAPAAAVPVLAGLRFAERPALAALAVLALAAVFFASYLLLVRLSRRRLRHRLAAPRLEMETGLRMTHGKPGA